MLETLKNLRMICAMLGTVALVLNLTIWSGDGITVIIVLVLIPILVLTNAVVRESMQESGERCIELTLNPINGFCDQGEEDGVAWQVKKTSEVCFKITAGKRNEYVYVKREPLFGLPVRELGRIKAVLTGVVNIAREEQKYEENGEFY